MKKLLRKWLGIDEIERNTNLKMDVTRNEIEDMLMKFRGKYNKPFWKNLAKSIVDEYLDARTKQLEKDGLLNNNTQV